MAAYDITALSTALEFDTTNASSISAERVSGTDWVAVSWVRSSSLVLVQLFALNRITGAMTAVGSPLDIEPSTLGSTQFGTQVVVIDSSNLMVIWASAGSDGFAQLVTIDGGGNLSLNGSALEYDATQGINPGAILWDNTHVLVAWAGSPNSNAQVLSFNTGAGTISTVGSPFAFLVGSSRVNSLVKLTSTKALLTYGASDFLGIILDVNASTFAVSAAGSALTIDTSSNAPVMSGPILVSSSPMVVSVFWQPSILSDDVTHMQTFNIDTGTWAITAFGSDFGPSVTRGTGGIPGCRPFVLIDSSTIFLTCQDRSVTNDLSVNTISYNDSTGDLATIDNLVINGTSILNTNAISMDDGDGLYVSVWSGNSTNGFMQAFSVEVAASDISKISTVSYANVGKVAGISKASISKIMGVA